jgi:hypothetical protein
VNASGATLVATGVLPALLLVSAALTAIVSAWLLRRYRRAVITSMARHAGADPPVDRMPLATTGGPGLQVMTIDPASAPMRAEARRSSVTDQAAWKAAGVYAAAGLAYAVVLALPWMVMGGGGLPVGRFVWLVACYLWPVTFAAGLVAAVGRPHRLLIAAAYAAIVVAAAGFALARNPELTPWQLAFFWLYANTPATVLLAAFLRRSVRAVGPLVFAFTTAGVAGAFLAIELAGRSDAVLRTAIRLGEPAGLGAIGTFVLLQLAGFAAFGVIGWQLLLWIGRRYRAKRFSDESLTVDAVWLLFAVAQSFTFAFEDPAWMLAGPAAFAAYKGVSSVLFARLAAGWAHSGRTLLVLRVFALGPKSHRFFESLAKRWLRTGPMTLIAGPDLATATIEPHEFLDFVGGRLSRQFVSGDADLGRRLRDLDTRPDPDGRHRVNEFFCYADTWQLAMRELAGRSDAVLMDLRGFSASHQGCIYELGQLLAGVDLARIVFAIDASTDLPFLERTLADLWRTTPADSPNRRVATPVVRLLSVTVPSASELRTLVGLLLDEHARLVTATQP